MTAAAPLDQIDPDAYGRLGIRLYDPYPKQKEFHKLGATRRERCLLAGNRNGKTFCGGGEVAIHTTGRYPDWWEGRRFEGPNRWWVANTNIETTRDVPQRILLGDIHAQGTGSIPAVDIVKVVMGRGIADQVDRIYVRHQSGGISEISFKAYDQERRKWQGEKLHGVWFDEEPPPDVYIEGVTRTHDLKGITFLTATPLLGMSEVVAMFYPSPEVEQRGLVQMTLDDALHFDDETRAEMLASFRPHEREARAKGIPMLGSGRIFPIPEAEIVEPPIEHIPDGWPRIIGMDFGWDHPTTAVLLAWDRDADVLHLVREYRQSQETTVVHAAALKRWGNTPVAWPRDAFHHDKQSGVSTAEAYRSEGLMMLPEHATHEAGGLGLESGIAEMLARMQTGRWKVSELCHGWIEEFRTYHRKDGKVVAQKNDLLDASRYAMMMKRFALAAVRVRLPIQVGMDYDPLSPTAPLRSSRGVPADGGAGFDPFGRVH